MNNTADKTANAPIKAQEAPQQGFEKPPSITRRIGNTTFDIHIHFSETSKETFTDKVLRLIKNDPAADMRSSCN